MIRASLAAFDGVGSYRYEHRALEDAGSGVEVVTTGTIVSGDPFRSIREIAVGGETGWRQVQVGGALWTAQYGGPMVKDERGADPHPGPLDAWAATLLDVADAGIAFGAPVAEAVDGVALLRYAGTTVAEDPTAPPDPLGDEPLTAQVELVVDAGSGRLVAATVASQTVDGPPMWDPPVERARLESVRILGVDDPANADALAGWTSYAPLPSPSMAPGGDPALAPVVLGALDALAAASSFHAVTDATSLGAQQGEERIVVRGPEPAAEVWLTMEGRRQVGLRMIGDEAWNAFGGTGAWQSMEAAGPTCFGEPCDVARLADLLGPALRPIAETFTELPPETLDGVAVRHLRSDAGSVAADGAIPGTTDLWIDVATGLPVRIRFDGQALTRDTVISQVGDPALTVQRPSA